MGVSVPASHMDKIDEELGGLERDIRTLKIEYEQYFGGGRSRPPNDTIWRIEQAVKRYSERGADMSYGQRFRYNNLVQTYAKYQEIFRKRMKAKEEGTVQRHFGAAARAIEQERQRGVAAQASKEAAREASEQPAPAMAAASRAPAAPRRSATELVGEPGGYVVACSDPDREREKVKDLYNVLLEAKKSAGEKTDALTLENFTSFVRQKTAQLRQQAKCDAVEYAVQIENGQIKLKARVKG
ncbi:MAG TPA: MXAN_5187 C-terminal domain-containing protein [Candidatus Acidoferrales bacterium]|nr:MXAN_5187 C-terminal domain-containing protein [Candidatus Acidoferrales bacterium]